MSNELIYTLAENDRRKSERRATAEKIAFRAASINALMFLAGVLVAVYALAK